MMICICVYNHLCFVYAFSLYSARIIAMRYTRYILTKMNSLAHGVRHIKHTTDWLKRIPVDCIFNFVHVIFHFSSHFLFAIFISLFSFLWNVCCKRIHLLWYFGFLSWIINFRNVRSWCKLEKNVQEIPKCFMCHVSARMMGYFDNW